MLNNIKINKEKWCTLVQIAYHLTFAGGMIGGGNYYLQEFQKTRDTIVQQVDRAEGLVKKLETTIEKSVKQVTATVNKTTKAVSSSADKVSEAGKSISSTSEKINSNANQLKRVLKKVKKACRF